MEFTVVAKPIVWEPSGDGQQWDERQYGFSITYDPGEGDDYKYHASWGEGPEDSFGTLAEAQQWCQDYADGWVRECALVTPNDRVEGPPEGGPSRTSGCAAKATE